MRRRSGKPIDRQQMLIDWSAASQIEATPAALKEDVPAAVVSRSPELVQLLPWDFMAIFPAVLSDAIDAGVMSEEDALPENLAALHSEQGRVMEAALSDLDKFHDAKLRGVNLKTGKAPRGKQKKLDLLGLLDNEIARLERWYRTLLDTYETAFGSEAATAFDKAVRARHAGIEVLLAENTGCQGADVLRMPEPRPLRSAVESGVFGRDESGPIDPSGEEVQTITANHADVVIELLETFRAAGTGRSADDISSQIEEVVCKYADDFGAPAADQLLSYCRRRVLLNDPRPLPSL